MKTVTLCPKCLKGLGWLRIGLLWVALTAKGKHVNEVTVFHIYLNAVLSAMGCGGERNSNPKHSCVTVILKSMVIVAHQKIALS